MSHWRSDSLWWAKLLKRSSSPTLLCADFEPVPFLSRHASNTFDFHSLMNFQLCHLPGALHYAPLSEHYHRLHLEHQVPAARFY
jgi:hypothetical protein